MPEILSDELSELFQVEWKNRIRVFQHSETVLPSWQIRFHCVAVNKCFCGTNLLYNSTPFQYYKEDKSYWIIEDIEDERIAVKLSSDFDQIDLYCPDPYFIDNSMRLLCQAYKYRVLAENGLLLHSSVVIYEGTGIMFFGHSGAGKSTQADFWKKYRQADVLNYDHNYVYTRNKMYMVSSTPWGGKEGYYVNKTVPLKYIVFVQKSLNENRTELLNKANAFSSLYLHNYIFPFDSTIEDLYCKLISNLVAITPVYKMSCTFGETSVEMLYNTLFER